MVGPFEGHQKHTLKVKLEPGMFIRASVVTLDSYVDGETGGTSAPLWMERLSNVPGTSPLEFIRVYSWVYLAIREVLATPDVAVPYVDSWFSLVEYVGHIKVSRRAGSLDMDIMLATL